MTKRKPRGGDNEVAFVNRIIRDFASTDTANCYSWVYDTHWPWGRTTTTHVGTGDWRWAEVLALYFGVEIEVVHSKSEPVDKESAPQRSES